MLFSILRGQLIDRSVGNNMDNIEEDVRNVKRSLSMLGHFDGFDQKPEPHGFVPRPLDTAIKSFQKDNDLKIDGILKPAGETEEALFGRTADKIFGRFADSDLPPARQS